MCHPLGVCHDPRSWPKSWGLDPTEGPNRERRRLRTMHLGIAERFVKPDQREKLTAELARTHLSSILNAPPVFSKTAHNALTGKLITRIHN